MFFHLLLPSKSKSPAIGQARFVWVRKSPEQLRVSACPGENNGVSRKLIDQQKIAAYVAFPEISPFPRQFMVAVFGSQGTIVGDQ
jgi:hypothetical protein